MTMNNLEVINSALLKLSEIDFEGLSDELQYTFIVANSGLIQISTILEQMECEEK